MVGAADHALEDGGLLWRVPFWESMAAAGLGLQEGRETGGAHCLLVYESGGELAFPALFCFWKK